MSAPLSFGNAGSPFDDTRVGGYDSAPGPGGFNLSGFDTADGTTTVPAGVYLCKIERGELTHTKAGKTAYRLLFKTVEPSQHAGFTLWRWLLVGNGDAAADNRAKAALAPLGLLTSAHLRSPYPPLGTDVYVKTMATMRNDLQHGATNDIERFEPCDPPAGAVAPPNPFAVLPPDDTKEGGKQ